MERDPAEVLTRSAAPPDAVVRYADHSSGVIDLFWPATFGHGSGTLGSHSRDAEPVGQPTRPEDPADPANSPGTADSPAPHRLLVAVHGGFWREQWDRTQLRPLAAALVARGFVVATPEYRRGPKAWPDTSYDLARVLERVADLVAAVAPGLIDPTQPFTVTGHSAGGHLVLWGGLRAGPGRIRRIVALAPVADLVAAARSGMGHGAVRDFLGGAPDEIPTIYAQADPMRLLPGDVPVTVIQGVLDEDVPVAANRAVAHALSTAGSVTYVEVPDVEHFALVDPLAPVFQHTVLPLLEA